MFLVTCSLYSVEDNGTGNPIPLLLSYDNINICGRQSGYSLVNCCHMIALISVTDFLKHKQE